MERNVMNHPPLFLVKIYQKDNHRFTIHWNDGKIIDYTLNQLQKECPCANCNEQPVKNVQDDVRAVKIHNVGRYALRILYTSGCSTGIYSYAMLHRMKEEVVMKGNV
jgi:DUF971 family protein